MRKFGNTANKVRGILDVVREGEKVTARVIAGRLRVMGYRAKEGHIRMFIHYYMLHKHLERVRVNGINHYALVT